jgi:hypothetical protein
MSRQKFRKIKSKYKTVVPKSTAVDAVSQIESPQHIEASRERYFEFFLLISLLAFGIYQSVLYFGHKVVPNPDFPAFFETGRELLSLRIPSSFKRVPVLGLLQVFISYLVDGQHPGLTAGWLLNAILHPFNLVLFWLVGRQVVGKSALWLAIIAILNPQVIYLLTEPIAETTLLFFILLTFYFIFRRSSWAYVLASVTTMVRYEGAALILAAFVADMIYRKSRQERLRAFAYSALATIPLVIWMVGTFMNWGSESYLTLFGKEYSKLYVEPAESRTGFVKHIDVLWRTGFYPLLMPYPVASEAFIEMLWKLSKTVAFAGFFFGSIYGLCKRRWEILVLLLFFVPYFCIHTQFPSPLMRYHMPIFWIALLICLFGLQSVWKLIDRNGRAPRALVVILQVVVAVISVLWLVSLISYLPKTSFISPRSVSLPYVAMALAGAIFAGRLYVYKFRNFLREFSILALVCLIIVSNQFVLVRLVGDGQQDKEFKLLADWFAANARPGEKMGVYMAGTVKIFAPKAAEYIVGLPKASTPEEFVKACYDQNITYVVWATREGLRTDHTGYRQAGLHENIKQLATPKNTGPYQFVTQVGSERGYVNIFRLRPSSSGADTGKPASGSP